VNLLLPVLAGAGGMILLIILTKRAEWGLLAIVPASFFGKWNISTGTNVAFNITIVLILLLMGIWLLRTLVYERHLILVNSPLNQPVVFFITVLALSFVFGNILLIPQASEKASLFAQLGGWLLYFLSICSLLLPANLIKDLKILRIFVWQFLLLGSILIFTNLFPLSARFSNNMFVNGTFLGSTFWIWIAAFGTSYWQFSSKRKTLRNIFFSLLLSALLYRGWFQHREWVSGWLPPIIAVAVILWLRNWRLALAITVIAGILVGLQFSTIESSVMTDTQQYSASSRTWTWPILFDLFKASPILGLGPSNYYHFTPLFSIMGWYVKFNSHNNYIDILMQFGILGFVGFFWLITMIGRMAWRLKDVVQDEFSRVYVHACIGGLVAMLFSGLLADWFLPFLYNIGTNGFRFSIMNWLFLGGLVVIDRAQANKIG
jgi:O-antigen ligase